MALPSFLTRRPWGQKPEKQKLPEKKPDREPERKKLFQEWNQHADLTQAVLKEFGLTGVMDEEALVFLKASIPAALALGDAANVQRLVSCLNTVEIQEKKRRDAFDRLYALFDQHQDVVDWLDGERAKKIAAVQQQHAEKTSMN